MGPSEVVTAYGEAWNEPDEGSRRQLLEQAWADDGVYCDPTAEVDGREALVAHIAGFHQQFPGVRIEFTSGVEEHHGWLRFAWAMVGDGGATVMDGFDVGRLAPDGRLSQIVGFFGPFPEPAA
jgi:hypothetical protein